MAFFEPPPRPPEPGEPDEDDFEQPDWLGPPTNVLGTPVPLRLVLARTDEVMLWEDGGGGGPTTAFVSLS